LLTLILAICLQMLSSFGRKNVGQVWASYREEIMLPGTSQGGERRVKNDFALHCTTVFGRHCSVADATTMAVKYAEQVTLKGSNRSISCQFPHAKGLATGFKILEMQKKPLPDQFKNVRVYIRSTKVCALVITRNRHSNSSTQHAVHKHFLFVFADKGQVCESP
jgi:hypothetical protein